MRPGRRFVAALAIALTSPGWAGAAADPREWPQIHFAPGSPFLLPLREAVAGAARRLAAPRCQSIYADFRDTKGRPLYEKLMEQGETGQRYLARLHFYDGSRHPGCKPPASSPSRIPATGRVFICGPRFRQAWMARPRSVEITVIHEALHTLGLGEHPPTSQEYLGPCGVAVRMTRRNASGVDILNYVRKSHRLISARSSLNLLDIGSSASGCLALVRALPTASSSAFCNSQER